MTEKSETDQRVLAYVRGELSPAEARALEKDAAADNELAAEIALLNAVREQVRQMPDTDTANNATDLGWARLSKAIRAEKKGDAPSQFPVWRKPLHWPQPVWRAAAVFLGIVAVGQSAVLVNFALNSEPARYVTASEKQTEGPIAVIAFHGDAHEADIRELLLRVDAVIIDGPSALGVYRLRFASQDTLSDGLDIFEQSTEIVETAYRE